MRCAKQGTDSYGFISRFLLGKDTRHDFIHSTVIHWTIGVLYKMLLVKLIEGVEWTCKLNFVQPDIKKEINIKKCYHE